VRGGANGSVNDRSAVRMVRFTFDFFSTSVE
jgi:hypothetical protein